jgi:hypothetical protein
MINSQQSNISSRRIYILPVCPNLLGGTWLLLLLLNIYSTNVLFITYIFKFIIFLCFKFLLYFPLVLFGYSTNGLPLGLVQSTIHMHFTCSYACWGKKSLFSRICKPTFILDTRREKHAFWIAAPRHPFLLM